jgi:hypothetical protein
MTTPPTSRSFAAGWFSFGLHFFVLATIGAIAAIALGPVVQVKVIGGATLAFAALGALVCLLGVRTYDPIRWRRLSHQASSVGDSLQGAREAIGEPRQLAYARFAPDARGPRVATARVVWPV